ncbi:flagellar hook-basal body complex protein [Polynucleobacter sp. UK-FUSCHL-C3]|uniref:Flagellar hook protein FlgE n=1 Tax=Polynucleobacter sp. UK-FUSCHL-C3 TaxID=2955208 RepID=A0AAU8A0V7_9BURK
MAQYGIGLSALNAFSEAIDVTSNNIANGQTVGYKQAEYVFADQFFKAQNPQSRDRAGMGTSRMIIRRANTYGTISGTQNPLDLAIAGPGMFMLAKQVDGTVPTENPQKFQYTRNGQFAVDAENRIVNENGLFLVGYAADASGNVLDSSKSVLKLDTTAMAQQATKTSTINLNLDSRANPTSGGAFDPKSPASYSQSISQTVYDDKGASHTLSMFYKKVNSLDLVLTQQAGANTFTFEPKQAIGTSLNGEQASTIATTSTPAQVTGPIQTIYNSTLTYVSGGVENITGVKSVNVTAVGSGYTPGIYKNVPITASNGSAGSAGSGALATVVVAADGTLGSIKITDAGSGYISGNDLSLSANNIGGTGSGISLTRITALNIVGGTDGATVGSITQGVSPALTITNSGTGYLGKTPTLTVTTAGTGYTNGTYINVPLGGGSGTGAKGTVVVSGGAISSITTTDVGNGAYIPGDVLTLANTNIGGAGSGVVIGGLSAGTPALAVASGGTTTYTNVALTGGTGSSAKATVVVSGGTVSSVNITDVGNGSYVAGDVLTLANTNIGGSGTSVALAALTGSLSAGVTEAAPVTFRALTAGESITIGGLTLTASGAITASAVANGFANLSNGSTGNITSNGLWSGTLSGWRTSGVSGSGVTFISAVANNNAEDIKVVTNKVGTGALGSTYNLKLTDGTNLSLKQTTTKGETAQYKVEVDRFAMFATLDGVPVGQTSTGLGTSTIRLGATTTQEQTSLGTVAFVGGKNIDSLSRDQFGRPQFNTKVTIDASGGPGSTWGKTANGGVVQFSLDSTDLTGYSSAAQTYANEQDGTPTAQLSSYSFDTYGKLVAQYDNGKSVVKGQLILAAFNNFEGLIPVGGNGFHASAASGDPLIDKPNGSQMGAIRSQSVEESNVDLTQSLVKLMVLQRAYSAASQATKVQVATLVDDTLRIGQ